MTFYEITAADELGRRIPKVPSHLKPDGRPSSAAFKPKPNEDGLSVEIMALCSPDFAVRDSTKNALALFFAPTETCECLHDPVPESNADALIKGISKSISKQLANACTMLFVE
jgi:hypothetical protein